MPTYAEIDAQNKVTRVIVADSLQWCQTALGGTWIATHANGSLRKNYAGVGYSYSATLDAFIPPKSAYDYVLDEATGRWFFDKLSCIYVPIENHSGVYLSQSIYGLIHPGESGFYCPVFDHQTTVGLSCLALRPSESIPLAVAASSDELHQILTPFVALNKITNQEVQSISQAVQALAGQNVQVANFIPPSWQSFVMNYSQAIVAGFLVDGRI